MGNSVIQTRHAVSVVRENYPDAWVGVNLLGLDVIGMLRWTKAWPIDGVWSDDTGIDERPESWSVMPAILKATAEQRALGRRVEVFGGTAFKYRRAVAHDQLLMVAAKSAEVLDVVTTSGPGTAFSAEVSKLIEMRSGMGTTARLATASGVTPGNPAEMFAHVDDVLLATGIERDFGLIEQACGQTQKLLVNNIFG